MKIVVFGLTADPMTSAHMEIIERLSEKFDKVIVVPTNVNYYKNYKGHDRAMFSFTERYDALVEKCKNLKNVEVNDVERDAVEGWRFIHTLKKLMHYIETYDDYEKIKSQLEESKEEWYIAMGSDSLQNFKTWSEWENIIKLAKLVVFNRPGYSDNFPTDIEYEYLEMNNDISSTKVRKNLLSIMDKFESRIEESDFDIWIDDITWGKEYFEQKQMAL